MNAVLILKELKRELKGFLIGSTLVVAYLVMVISIYTSMDLGMDQFADMWSSLPQGFMTALNFDAAKWKSILGFYTTYFVLLIPLISGGFSVVWGLKMLSKEERHKTAEFLLTRPISRDQVVTSKLVMLITYIIGINFLAYLAGLISITIVAEKDFSITTYTILHFYGLASCLFYGALGLFISVLIRRGRSSTGIGIGIAMGLYMFDMILKISGKAEFLLYLTPYKYIDLEVTSPDYHLEGWRVLIPLGVSVVLVIISYVLYRRKDIYT